VYLGICEDRAEQRRIVEALSRKFLLDADVDFDALLAQCPLNLTGADFYALCSGAMARSLQRRVQQIEQHLEHAEGGKLTPQLYLAKLSDEELRCVVCQRDYEDALAQISPSVGPQDVARYQRLKKQFSPGQ